MPRVRILTLLSLIAVVPIGLGLKFYRGPAESFINDWSSSLAYECFWMLAAFFVLPRRAAITPIAIGVFLATCVIEVMQLWHPPALEALRRTFVGRMVLGTTFDPWDFAAYAVGCAIGWMWLHLISNSLGPKPFLDLTSP